MKTYIGRHLQTVHPIWMKFGTIAQWGTRRIVAKFRPNLACRSSAIAYGRFRVGFRHSCIVSRFETA